MAKEFWHNRQVDTNKLESDIHTGPYYIDVAFYENKYFVLSYL